jgi:phytoene dehydrogenase-like protein
MADALIVGAGMAGLACAHTLSQAGLTCTVIEAGDAVGGRVRTDRLEGFLLDRGFQIFLTAYPEAQPFLDYPSLSLRSFSPGALIRLNGGFHRIADPWRRPSSALRTLFSPVGTLADKVKLGKLRGRLLQSTADGATPSGISTMQFLRGFGFSPNLIERFFRPFLGGIFLEPDLETSSSMFEFVFRMFSLGDAVLPASGMGALAAQMAARLPAGCLRLQERVVKVDAGAITLASGQEIKAPTIVVAADQFNASRLLPQMKPASFRSTTCVYFAADKPPVTEPILVLNGEGSGPVNNLCVPSLVSPAYAPAGAHLISASMIGESKLSSHQLLSQARDQLAGWFGEEVRRWRHLRTDCIPHALPQPKPTSADFQLAGSPTAGSSPSDSQRDEIPLPHGVYLCGDYCQTASINGALASGRKTAEAILAAIQR